ncbi:MAG: NADH-quinone oxidoreductase subunit J [Alphaproteobacteria bacterium]
MLATLLFYFFSGLLLTSSACVILMRETVHSVFFLILAFINAAGLFVLAGAEFLAMLLVVVYVGAVAVLFLFVVMMLGVDFKKLRDTSGPYRIVGGIVGGLLCLELIVAMVGWVAFPESFHLASLPMSMTSKSNAHQLGHVLYTTYFLPFQIAGFILLVAMIGAIVLTLRLREDVKRQSVREQISQKGKESVTLVDVPIGKGV